MKEGDVPEVFKPADCIDVRDVAAYLNRAEAMLRACDPAVQEALGVHRRVWPRHDFSTFLELMHEPVAPGERGRFNCTFPTDRQVLVESVEAPEGVRLMVGVGVKIVAEGYDQLTCWAGVPPRQNVFIEVHNPTDRPVKGSDLRLYGYVLDYADLEERP